MIDKIIAETSKTLSNEGLEAYRVYTRAMLRDAQQSKTFSDFQKKAKTHGARLGQAFGACVKRAKYPVCAYYAEKIIGLFSPSTRELEAILKEVTGHSISRENWAGKLNKSTTNRSKYFTSYEYREQLYSHDIFIEFREKFDALLIIIEQWKVGKNNPEKFKIEAAIAANFSKQPPR